MDNSILDDTKKLLGIDSTVTSFDTDIKISINTVLSELCHMGIGPSTPISITDNSTLWTAFTQEPVTLNLVKSYMYLKVRLLFDPPTNNSIKESYEKNADELKYRMYIIGGNH